MSSMEYNRGDIISFPELFNAPVGTLGVSDLGHTAVLIAKDLIEVDRRNCMHFVPSMDAPPIGELELFRIGY